MIHLILLQGLPGAGKTYLCHLLKTMIHTQNKNHEKDDHLSVEIHHIEFDTYWPTLPITTRGEMKSIRNDIYNHVVQLGTSFEKNSKLKDSWILLDDNMVFYSMRKPYLRLAGTRQWHYIHLVLSPPLTMCLVQNAKREIPISDDIIHHMASTQMQKARQNEVPFVHHLDESFMITDVYEYIRSSCIPPGHQNVVLDRDTIKNEKNIVVVLNEKQKQDEWCRTKIHEYLNSSSSVKLSIGIKETHARSLSIWKKEMKRKKFSTVLQWQQAFDEHVSEMEKKEQNERTFI